MNFFCHLMSWILEKEPKNYKMVTQVTVTVVTVTVVTNFRFSGHKFLKWSISTTLEGSLSCRYPEQLGYIKHFQQHGCYVLIIGVTVVTLKTLTCIFAPLWSRNSTLLLPRAQNCCINIVERTETPKVAYSVGTS